MPSIAGKTWVSSPDPDMKVCRTRAIASTTSSRNKNANTTNFATYMNIFNKLHDYIDDNFELFVKRLTQWLSIPSISTLPANRKEVSEAALWILDQLEAAGLNDATVIETKGHPLVFGQKLVNPDLPTLLIYGHYDVQPVDPLEEWITPPFSPDIRDGAIYARGASDDKGQVLLVLFAIEAWTRTAGAVPVNIKVVLEGEEESSGDAIEKYVTANPEMFSADAVLICDTPMMSATQPSIITSLRGIVYSEIAMSGASSDLHSGSYGGVAPNPVHGLCLLLGKLKQEDGVIRIPELQKALDDSSAPTRAELDYWQQNGRAIRAELCRTMGVTQLVGETERPPLECIGLRPTLEIHGIRGGFVGEGEKTVIPAKALAKVSLRVPPGLDPDKVAEWFTKAVRDNSPQGYETETRILHIGRGLAVDPENSYFRAAVRALEKTYGKGPLLTREGGSIPVAALFNEILQIPVILMGFGLPDDNLHAPNEKFSLEQFRRGIKTVALFLKEIT